MTEEWYLIAITVLLPLAAGLLVLQVNPYHALVLRGILGAIAALVYCLFGAADVALTEALVGTMLSITLYAVAVRSSMRMKVGVLQDESASILSTQDEKSSSSSPCIDSLQEILKPHHLRLEWITYCDHDALQTALETKEIHGALFAPQRVQNPSNLKEPIKYDLHLRIQRLYDLIESERPDALDQICLCSPQSKPKTSTLVEEQP